MYSCTGKNGMNHLVFWEGRGKLKDRVSKLELSKLTNDTRNMFVDQRHSSLNEMVLNILDNCCDVCGVYSKQIREVKEVKYRIEMPKGSMVTYTQECEEGAEGAQPWIKEVKYCKHCLEKKEKQAKKPNAKGGQK